MKARIKSACLCFLCATLRRMAKKKTTAETKGERVTVLYTEEQLHLIGAAAAQKGLDPSPYIRMVSIEAARSDGARPEAAVKPGAKSDASTEKPRKP